MSMDMPAKTPRTMSSPPATSSLPDIAGLGGAVAGIGGGIAMAVVGALIALVMGTDIFLTPKQIAAVIMGPEAAAQPGFVAGPVIAGSVIHLIVSAGLGALFGIAMRRVFHLPSGFGLPLVSGLIYGLAIWLIAYFFLLPVVNPVLLSIYAPSFIIQNIVYGTVTGILYGVLRP